MFGLPLSTTLLLVGFPLLWVAYTVIFLVVTRKWDQRANQPEDDS
jgi:hypothetical protein